VSNLAARSLLAQLYQSSHGIFDHLAQAEFSGDPATARPLAANEMHDTESLSHEFVNGIIPTYKSRMQVFARLKLGATFNISFIEFMGLPRTLMEDMIETGEEQQKAAATSEAELKELLEGGGQPPQEA
jgi:hypothetical protein